MATIASGADAGVYEVRSCGASAASAYAPTNRSPGTMATGAQCPPVAGTLLSGLFAAPTAGTFTPDGLSSGWTVSTPAGLTLRRLDVHRSIGTRRSNWKAVVRTAEGAELESACSASSSNASGAIRPDDSSATYAGLSTRGVTFSIECHTDPVGLTCPGRTLHAGMGRDLQLGRPDRRSRSPDRGAADRSAAHARVAQREREL